LYIRVPKFSKQYKYMLGEKILECCVESLSCIQEISMERDRQARKDLLEIILKNMNNLLLYLRIANELNQLGKKEAYYHLSSKIVEVVNQAENWKKSLQKNSIPESCTRGVQECGKRIPPSTPL